MQWLGPSETSIIITWRLFYWVQTRKRHLGCIRWWSSLEDDIIPCRFITTSQRLFCCLFCLCSFLAITHYAWALDVWNVFDLLCRGDILSLSVIKILLLFTRLFVLCVVLLWFKEPVQGENKPDQTQITEKMIWFSIAMRFAAFSIVCGHSLSSSSSFQTLSLHSSAHGERERDGEFHFFNVNTFLFHPQQQW